MSILKQNGFLQEFTNVHFVSSVQECRCPIRSWEQAFFVLLFRVKPVAHGGSQTRGRIEAIRAAGLRHSHERSELRLPPTPQPTAMLDP